MVSMLAKTTQSVWYNVLVVFNCLLVLNNQTLRIYTGLLWNDFCFWGTGFLSQGLAITVK